MEALKADIISSDNYFKTKNARSAAFTAFLILLAALRFLRHSDEVGLMLVLLILFVLLGMYLIISYWHSRQAKKIGTLCLTPSLIEITQNNQKSQFEIANLETFIIEHNTMVGEDYGPANSKNLRVDYFGDNWVILTQGDKHIRIEFKIDSHFKNNKLKKLVEHYKLNSSFEYIVK